MHPQAALDGTCARLDKHPEDVCFVHYFNDNNNQNLIDRIRVYLVRIRLGVSLPEGSERAAPAARAEQQQRSHSSSSADHVVGITRSEQRKKNVPPCTRYGLLSLVYRMVPTTI